jgi:hypothetical protein
VREHDALAGATCLKSSARFGLAASPSCGRTPTLDLDGQAIAAGFSTHRAADVGLARLRARCHGHGRSSMEFLSQQKAPPVWSLRYSSVVSGRRARHNSQ